VICHTPIPEARQLPVGYAVKLQKRFGEYIAQIGEMIKNGKSDQIHKLFEFGMRTDWAELAKAGESIIEKEREAQK